MNTQEAITLAGKHLKTLSGHTFDVLNISKPSDVDTAVNLSKVISKLSPLVGNLIEFETVKFLNTIDEFNSLGKWARQDPGFPDAIFNGSISPTPGFEIKAWFPLATEITARFKDSQNHFQHDQTHVVMLAWLPEFLIYGKPKIIDVCIVSGLSVAQARDNHYHNPPDYLVMEPQDTSGRTQNLQQTNTNGFKFQGTAEARARAEQFVKSWGASGSLYSADPVYQSKLQELIGQFTYRGDTNFAKMDRIVHSDIESFKSSVLNSNFCGKSINQWRDHINASNENMIQADLKSFLDL
jgi:hypothetical protein